MADDVLKYEARCVASRIENKQMTDELRESLGRKGLVEIFTGDGKGKTSAALGVVLRALGHDFRVFVVHFMKGNFPYGEQKILSSFPDVTLAVFGRLTFVDPKNPEEIDKEEARKALEAGREAVLSGKYDLVVLDEVNVASAWGLVPVEDVINLIKEKPEHVELILTGRYADDRLIELADLVTEMNLVKHPFEKGISARAGLDY
jgi:cob(I)alamin adenosyltransferase